MRDTRLILIDGLPGSGKSTTAEMLTARLQGAGIKTRLLAERTPNHPLNVGGELHPSGDASGPEFFDRYSVETVAAESIARWQAFVAERLAETNDKKTVTVAESYPFQNSLRILMQMGAEPDALFAYAAQVEEIIAPLHPVLVFFAHSDPGAAFRRICELRGPEWTEQMVALATASAAARAMGITGKQSVELLITTYNDRMNALVARFPYPVLTLRNCAPNRWDECHREIDTFLQIA